MHFQVCLHTHTHKLKIVKMKTIKDKERKTHNHALETAVYCLVEAHKNREQFSLEYIQLLSGEQKIETLPYRKHVEVQAR